MLYPQNIEIKLGFDKIRERLNELCVSTLGRNFVEKVRFSDNYDLIQKMIRQVDEMKNILQFEPTAFPSQNYLDVNYQLSKASIEGAFLTEEEFFNVKLSLRTIQECLRFFDKKEPEEFPQLRELALNALTSPPVPLLNERGESDAFIPLSLSRGVGGQVSAFKANSLNCGNSSGSFLSKKRKHS